MKLLLLALTDTAEAATGKVYGRLIHFPEYHEPRSSSRIFSQAGPTLRCPISTVLAMAPPVAAALSLLMLSFIDTDHPRYTSMAFGVQ